MVEPLTRRAKPDDEDPPEAWEALDPEAHGRAVAEYMAEMIKELESLSRRAGMDLLTYLLSMARLEAENNARTGRERLRR